MAKTVDEQLKVNSDYWTKRFSAVEAMNHRNAQKAVSSLLPEFNKAQIKIQGAIETWYQRFADNNEIDLADAQKWLSAGDLKELKWDIEEYIQYGRENAIDQRWMKELENASSRYHISRLQALQIRTQQAAEVAFGKEQTVLTDAIRSTYSNGYYHTAYEIQKGIGIGFDVGTIDQDRLAKLLNKPWTADGMTFSDRIWRSKSQLVDSVSKELTQMCILGKAPDEAIRNISRRMDVSKSQAGRLVMTESAYFASAAQKDCYNDLDVEEYEIVATLDSRTSKLCRDLDGHVFKMSEYKAGVTAPPFHVWCRSTTVPYFNDEFTLTDKRAARDDDGNTIEVDANMKYADWKKSFVYSDKLKSVETNKDDLTSTPLNDTIKLPDIEIHKSVGAKAKNYDVFAPESPKAFHFAEGTKIQNSEVFAGKGTNHPLKEDVSEGLTKQYGGSPEKWQHCKGNGVIDFFGEERKAEVHWFQEETVGKVKFKIKRWLDED